MRNRIASSILIILTGIAAGNPTLAQNKAGADEVARYTKHLIASGWKGSADIWFIVNNETPYTLTIKPINTPFQSTHLHYQLSAEDSDCVHYEMIIKPQEKHDPICIEQKYVDCWNNPISTAGGWSIDIKTNPNDCVFPSIHTTNCWYWDTQWIPDSEAPDEDEGKNQYRFHYQPGDITYGKNVFSPDVPPITINATDGKVEDHDAYLMTIKTKK